MCAFEMVEKRLPSFNDFSPKILQGDLRACLAAVRDGAGDDKCVIQAWSEKYFGGKHNKRSSANIPATLRSTGLSTGGRPIELSPFGLEVLNACSAEEAAQIFCREIIRHRNGDILLDAIASLRKRKEEITKVSLKVELKRFGVASLSNATTDHTTLMSWMEEAKIIDEDGVPNDPLIKSLLGISATEMDEWAGLPLAQQVFLRQLRREHVLGPGPFPMRDLLRSCLELYPDLFDESQFAKQVQKPLVASGWIEVSGLAGGKQGGKSGYVSGTEKLTGIPVDSVIPDFDNVVPSELRAKIDTPLAEIKENLFGSDKHLGGLALELLALRIVLDLGLDPRNFRVRSAATAYAEVDLMAEGSHLMFSRWTFQCKRYGSSTKVGLGDVAKEVGIALFVKAHVVVMVTTTSFTSEANRYAEAISKDTPLQFLFVDGKAVEEYLTKGKSALLAHARDNAASVMAQKRSQPTIADAE